MALLEHDLARLSPQQRAALETLLLKRSAPAPPAGAPEARIVRVTRAGDPAPLSFAQQRLWFIDQFEPGSPLYNMPIALRIAGPLASAVLDRCLGEIVRRHEVLRTVFAAKKGVPLQVIQSPQPFLLPVVDLAGLPESERESLSLSLVHEEVVRPFDLSSGPLLRGVLLRLGREDHVVALTMHHIVSDAWSLGILVREVTVLYPAFAANRPSPLPDLPIQYTDFAVWQRGWLDREVLQGQVAYWRQRLAGAPAQLDLPGARPRPAMPSLQGAARERRFPPPLLEQLHALGRRESATLFMTLLASLQALLFSRTGVADLVVGTDVAGRDRSESEGLIGFFINQLPLRADLTGDPTLAELLGRVRQTALEAFTHQDLPFDRLVEALRVERRLRLSPVFQVKLVLQPPLRESLELPGLTLEVLDPGAETAQVDLHWSCLERGDELWLVLTYSTDLYDEPLIDELLDHYESWLRAFAERPEARLGDVSKNLGKLTTEPIEQGFRPSPQQLRAWRLQKDGATSCSLCSLRMEGDLDRRALQRALAATVARHEILRTAFRLPAGLSMPLQIILDPGAVSLPEVDFRDLSPKHRMAGLTALLAVLGAPPFALEQGEGWRAALVQLSPGEHELLLALSAVCADAGAFELFAAELGAAYLREVAGGSGTSEPPLQYADVAEWLNSLLEGEGAEEGLEIWREHWKEHDLDARIALPLPLQKTETAPGPFAPREVAVPLTRETAGALARLAEVWGHPFQVLILTAWKTVIQRGTGRDESLVGVLYPGRATEELRGVVGPLARFLPIAARFSLESSLRDAAAQVWQAMEKAEPWEKYFNWDHIAGTSHRAGGFPVCFEAARNDWKLAVNGLRVTPVWRSCALLDSFSLALSCLGEGEGLQLVLRYDTRRFQRDAAVRLAERLAGLLGSVASRPEAPLADHPAMAEEELSWWLELSSAPQSAGRLREGKTLAAVFEEQVDRAPDRLAVVDGDRRLTFRELDERANRLAHYLRAAGAGREVPVALCLERSAEAVVALLAVWKAGSAYVPLDPTQPAERLTYILADTEAPLLVTGSRLAHGLPGAGSLPGVRTVCLDKEAAAIVAEPADRPVSEAGPRSLAYVIYTSGSTGRPKGVQVEHRSPLHLLTALEAAVLDPLAAEPGSRPDPLLASLNAPLIFDASVQQLVLLLAGHALCVVPEEIRADGPALVAFLRQQGVGLLDCTPSQLRLLVDGGLLDGSSCPRIVLTAGEAVDERLWRRLTQAERTVSFNLYGPTECSVDATFHRIEPGSVRPTIGRPLAGYEAFLLDRVLQPVPPGAPGELCLGGAGLARGYLRRPDLTAERFVPHPFARMAGERLYRTGDLGRHLSDGDLEFLGRLDHQVKIRGFRIELGEIEAELLALAGVREAVMVARDDHSGPDDRRLVAYVVGDSAMGSEAVLRQALRERLPDYMVPAGFVMLSALPLTPTGKVDRKALPAPEQQRSREAYLAPCTPVEEVLCGIWAEVLGVERVGMADQFFELGGHSLLATQVMSRLRSAFAIEMPLRDLFTAPRLADLAVRVEEALHAGRRRPAPPLVPQERERASPLSFAQLRLWFIDQLEVGSLAYNLPTAVRLRGPLRPAILQAALSETVRRHSVLRTVFRAAPDGEPVQVIRPATVVPLPRLDLSELPEVRREEELRHLAREEAWRPFDLAQGPLLRTALAVLGKEEHAVFLVIHHIASDGWSSAVLIRELESLVGAFGQGLPSPLPELAIQYADFAGWQRSWMTGEVLAAETAFWREQLDGIPSELALPTDRPRPALPTFRGAQQPLRLPASLTGRLQALARSQGATLFMTVLAGFQGLLGRMSGQESFAVGTPVAGRNRLQTEGLIGCFVNMLALRADLSGDPPAEELVARVRNTSLAAYTHQDVPFEKLVEELQPERSLSHSPLFQVALILQNQPAPVPAFGGLRFELLPLDSDMAKLDLTLLLVPDGDALAGVLEHSLDLFDPATAERLAERLLLLLDGLAADPQRRLAELPLLSPVEQEQLLADWTGPRLEPRWAGPVHGLFARHAERDPDAPAMLFAGDVVSYGTLHRRASALAAHLAALGVGPETLVALAVDSSPEMIVGLFAILEAGGAYLPLDPAAPPERLARLLADAGAPLVLTQERHRDAFAGCGVRLVCLDACPPPEEGSPPLPRGRSFPESAAYVIHTSGSTGLPKGVVAHHGGLASFTRAMAAALALGPGDRVLQFASLTFDASAVQIFPALVSGAALVLHPDPRRLSPSEILDLCVETGVTVLDLPAALWRQWVTALPPKALGRTAIRAYLTGGEAVPAAILRAWAERAAPGATFLSSYGPTEATVTTTAFQTSQEGVAGIAGTEAPLGRPLPNTRLVLLDLYGQTPPQGTPGELYIGGAGLTRGYLHEPGLTAERFVPDPVSGEPGARLYRTGDLARLLPGGELLFLGRSDHQVKIRGFRIEPGEIETVLSSLPGVRQAVVVAREIAGSKTLVAYISGEEPLATAGELRELLRRRLPEHMIPAFFVALPELPLTPSGKVDRKALPAPEEPSSAQRHVAPRTPVEEILADIWAEVLGIERTGADDSFFDLGGHSLLATQVVSRLRSTFGVEIPLRDLFEAPRLADLAARIEVAQRSGTPVSVPPLLPLPRHGALPLSFAQERLWFIDQLEPGSPLYNLPVALRIEGPLAGRVLALCLGEVTRRHEALRTVFPTAKGSPAQVIRSAAPFELPVVDLAGLPAGRREPTALGLAGEEAGRPFDLAGGLLLRGVLVRLAESDHVAALTMHHIVSDGWSMGILVQEIVALYRAFLEQKPSPLPELTLQYADFALWQRSWLHGAVLTEQVAYWRRHLEGAPRILDLPLDRPRPARQTFRGALRSVDLAPDLVAALRAFCRREDATPFMVLLAAWSILLGRHAGQQVVVVGSPIAGRNRVEIEGLIGFFVNTLALRVDLHGMPGFAGLVARTRGAALNGYAHQDVPFERLVDELAAERDLAASPLFQTVLALQNAPVQPLSVEGLTLTPVGGDGGTAKFDLTLTLGEGGDQGYGGALEYSTGLFDRTTADRLVNHFTTLLASVLAEPQAHVWEIPLLGAAERRELLAWSGAGEIYPPAGSLHSRFEEQAARRPDATAVVFAETFLTYRDLDRWANDLAHRLSNAGVAPGARVCLAAERGLGLVASILGILKAGCAYVPLDPSYPQERLAWMLEDAGAAALVREEGVLDRLPAWPGRVLPLAAGGGRQESPRVAVAPQSPAYVIYTSGSTGRPKGVVVSHANVLRLMDSTEGWFGFDSADVWTLFHSFAFDFSVWELWGALLHGGRLVVVPYPVSRSPEAMLELVERQGVTVLNQTPSAFQVFQPAEAQREEPGARSLRWVIFGGEALEPRSLEGWWRRRELRSPGSPGLVNMYGITETTVHVTWRRLGESEILGGGGSVIGVPLGDLWVHVLDPWGQPVPVGVAGELYVGGAGLSPGYLGLPALTAERFVPDGFAATPSARLYRSGDLGRRRRCGELEFLGRIDQQVKIRGFRIELGEIEAALLRQPGVEAAAVLLREDTPGDRRLVAYVAGPATGGQELRHRLRESLPEHMVPAAFVALAGLPVTANGKVDRRALPAPGVQRPWLTAEYVAPRTFAEEVLAVILEQVLGTEQVGIHDNFFALGGDSILSVQVVALARERGLAVDLRDVFEHQTLAELGPRVRLIQGKIDEGRSEPLSLVSAEDRVKLPAGVEDAYPLTLLQAGMLFHMDLAPDDPPYHNVDSWHLRTPFAQELFEKAVGRVLARHPVLRTSFDLTGYSEPLQLVHRRAHLPVPAIDLTALDPARHEEVLLGFVAGEKRRLHDRSLPPQLRVHVHLRTKDSFQLTLTENHAILDGWSLNSTLSEIFAGYFAMLAGQELMGEAPPSASFRDFVRLERLALESAEQRRFWEERLRDAPRTVLPPADGPVPAGPRLGTADLLIPPPITDRLRRLAAEAIVPLKSVLLAAHLKAMALVSGECEVLTGLTSHGRPETLGGEAVRGLFLNVLPFRFTPGEGTWEDLVRGTFQAELEVLPFRRYPMAALQQTEKSGPLFETAFNYLHFHVVEDLLRSGNVEVLGAMRREGNNFALSVTFTQNPLASDLLLGLEYDRQRLSDGRARWWLAELYERVLAAIATHPSEYHAAACLLAENERHQLLAEWNDTAVSRSPGHLLHGLFQAQAARTPDAPAITFDGRAITYAGLDRLTDRLAGHLDRLGVRPDMAVGILMERSIEMVVALLGILKAGGGYLPLDPEYPRERLVGMIDEARMPVLLAQRRLLPASSTVEAWAGCQIVLLEEGWNGSETEDGEATLPRISDGNLAYVLYTSGSTGRPKGVMIPHCGIVNRLLWMQETYDLTPDDRVLQKTPYSFDVSVWEFFWPLCTGACLVVARPGVHRDSAGLAKLVEREGITVMHFVPSMLQAFLEEPDLTGCAALRLVVASGEALSPELRRRCLDRLPARLENLYGPTEASVDVTAWSCAAAARRDIVPIGRPVANTWTYLFDPSLQPVPAGVAGELCIGGAQLARGYLHRPDLTAARFVPDPGGGGRLYRTGDLARHLPDGAIEFLGRIDHQVKIRGFRIEPGEIEAALLALSGVRQAVVVAREIAGSKALVAYIAGEEPPATAVELRELLRRQLPEHMIPAFFVALDRLPLTPNGKVDRKALPAPEPPGSAVSHVAPRTPVEEVLSTIWAEVLGRERVGATDSFFDLGGHSLLATQVMSRLRRAFGIEVPLRDLFAAPRLADLAGRIEEALRTGARQVTPPLLPQPREGVLPLSFAQQRLWFIDQLEPDSPLYNIPVALRVEGPLDRAVLARCLGEIVRRHEALRTAFTARDGAPMQVVQPPEPFLLPMVDVSGLPETARAAAALHLARDEAGRAFNLARGPMLRGLFLRLAEGDHIAALTMHHIASDEWSMGILVREVAALYAAFAAGLPSPLPELPVQYADFAVWQHSWLRGEVLENEISFWRRRLAGLPPLLELPTDRPRPAMQSYRGTTRPVRLTAGLIRQATALARREGATLFMVVLAGFQTLLARYSGQDDLAVGSPVAGRNRMEIEGLIGFFVNTLVLRCDLAGNPTFRELLDKVHEAALAAYMHQDLPFEKVVEELAPERSLAHTPLFQVMLALQNVPVESLEIRDLRLQPVGGAEPTARFDLTLVLGEHGGELVGTVEYATDLFDAATIDRLVVHSERLLAAAVAAPELALADLPLLSPAERHQVIAEWNDTVVPSAGPTTCFDPLFAEQVRRAPEAVAVAMGELRLTYGELDRQVDRMAWALLGAGVEHDEVVPLLAHRSPDFLTAVLALFRAGGAYLPLDPLHPMQRIVQIIAASGARRVLASRAFGPALALHEKAGEPQLLILEDFHAAEDKPSSASRAPRCPQPSNLAYVIYTSGSTGVPKGAMLEQRGMVNHLWAKVMGLDLRPSDRIAQTASQCFDISVWQFLAPLVVGGQVHIFPDEVAHDAWELLHEVERQGITLLEIVPSLLRFLVAELDKQEEENRPALQQLRWLLSTGEALPPDLCRDWLRLYPAMPLLNAYGPTECSDDVSHHPIPRSMQPEEARIPIGRPIPGLTLYILNSSLQPVPAGVVGELFVGGAGVGRGYLGDGAQTAKSFWPDPMSGEPGARLYRTGDLARYRPEGEIEYLGRIDHQVKVRGHRIELGEIEAVLADHPEVRAAAVIVGEDAFGQERLVAYAVPGRDEELDHERVGRWRTVFDEVYGSGSRSEHDSGINLRVWISSYTGEPLAESEIFECFEDSVARILALRPSRLLEIGCGTGLLLQRIAPSCAACTGTDISKEALRFLEASLAEQSNVPPVDLLQRAADDFEGIPPGSFDVVVLNEVAQYFPSVEYLVRVVEGAVAAAAPGGAVFLGGLRSFPLLEAFHTSVELFRSPASRPLAQVREAAWRRLIQDKELAVDPALFEELARRLPRVASLSIQLKGGRARNELTCFRYDTILRIQGRPEPLPLTSGPRLTTWDGDWTLETLCRALAEGPEALAIRGVPNARVLAEIEALRRIRDGEGPGTAGELRGEIAAIPGGVEPADLWGFAAELGREAEVRWSAEGPERLDILFHLPGARPPWPFRASREDAPWSRYANRPDRGEASEELLPRLRTFASEQLPEWMVPSAWVLLGELPLTPNGKLDRKALPVPGPVRSAAAGAWTAPRGQIEEMLAVIWAEVLGLERVGATDHFFDLGGHSLLATQVVSRLRSAFGIELPLRDLFAAPRLADLAVRVEEALRSGAREIAPPLVPRPREGAVPLSFAQQRLWFIDQLEPGTPLYNIPVALGVEGPLDRAVLALCLGEIVRRHEALRTVFTAQDGAPVQVIQPTEPFLLPMVDLSGLPETTREGTVLHLVGEEAGRAFDLARGPMLRGLLLRMAQEDHVAAFTMHHIASDGWSMDILVREVAALYPALAAGQPSPLPELPVQYADFSVWQRSWLSGEVLENEIAFWRRQLAGLPPLLELPTDRPRPALQSFRGTTRPVRLAAGPTRQLEALARREGATLFMVLLAGFQTLLARYSGQDDFAVGSPIAGRNRVEIEDLIGFFVNTLILRGDLSGEPSFRELLGRVRETALSAYVHQDVPFEKLVEELAPERSLAHTPLFQAMLVLQNARLGNLEIEGLRLRPVSAETATAKFDLTMSLTEHSGGLSGEAEHATDLFDDTTIDHLVGHFERLLAAALETPERRVAELPLMSEAERAQILVEWNDTGTAAVPRAGAWSGAATAPAGSGCLHELFETQVARTPEATALIAGEDRWTYDALNRRANRLAHHMRRLGVGPEQRVGVMMRRSAELIATLLAVLKAGAAYVPLDPAYPDHWRAFAAEDARITFLLTEAAAEEISGESEQNPQRLAVPGNLAYVLYTSGSTGRPKGVAIEHRAPVERMLWARDAFSAADLAGVLAATSVCFDLSVFEIFAPLSWGGRVILADHALALPALPACEEVTLLNTVPSAMAELASGALPPRLHTVNLAGEALSPALVERIYRHAQVEQVCNLYGPTEDATYSTWERVGRGASRVSIGRPLPGTRAYVLDRHLQPVPGGVMGELYLAGAGGARGYLGRPELTAERFLPNPFTAQPGGRLYRTGDLARWLAAGELEHMGRLDHQVKVRGFRIELPEIEAALRQHPEIRDVVVLAREDVAGDKRLAAYLVAASAADPRPDAWRIFLEERLPGSMVPSHFVVLDALPLLPNGKVDRQALPAPSGLRSGAGPLFVAPRTAGEEVFAAIWSEVLGLDRVGVADNFFSLGGHSLLATRVMARLRNLFGVDIPLRLIFEHPTVESLLASIKRLAGDERTVEEMASASRDLDRMSDQEVARILSEP